MEKVLQEGALQPLISLARRDNGDLESQRYAVFCLTNVAAARNNHPQLVDSGVVNLMAGLMENPDVEIRNSAAFFIANMSSNSVNHEIIMHEGCLGPLIAFAASEDPQAQLRAVSALRGLSTDEQLRTEIVSRDGIAPLLKLTRTEDVEVQMEVLSALCNLSLCGCIGDNPLSFLENVDVSNLVSFLCSADTTYRLFGAVTIGNIASNMNLQTPLTKQGALQPLITVANSADLETQRCIAYSLVNLCADEGNRESIVSQGGLPPIISLACSEDVSDMRAGLATIRGLSAAPTARRPIIDAGAIEALSMGSRCEEDIFCKRESATALCALSLNEQNKVDMANSSILADIVSLAQMPDIVCSRQSIGAIANLTENEDTHIKLLGEWGAGFLTALIDTDDSGLRREVTRCLTNLAGNYATHEMLTDADVPRGLVIAAQNPMDAIACRFALLGILNLSTQTKNHAKLMEAKAGDVLIELASGAIREYVTLKADGSQVPNDKSDLDYRAFQSLGYDLQCRRYANLALGNLCANRDNHESLLNSDVLGALASSLDVDDLETRFNACFAANKLAMNNDNILKMGEDEADIIPPLVRLIADPDTPARTQAISTLRRLALEQQNRIAIVSENALDPLADACSVEELETEREIAACVCTLALSESNKVVIVKSKIIEPLLHLCQSPDVEVSRFSLGAVANLSEDTLTHRTLVEQANAMHYLTFLMRSRHLAVHREACRAVSNLLATPATHRVFLDEDGLRALFGVARSLDNECQYNSSLCFRRISPNLANHDSIIAKGGLQPLIGLIQIRDVNVQRQAGAALRDIASNREHKVTFAQEGGLRAMIALAREEDLTLQVRRACERRAALDRRQRPMRASTTYFFLLACAPSPLTHPFAQILATGTLRHLSLSSRIKRPIVEEGALGPIFDRIMNNEDLDLLQQCAGTLANCAENGRNQISMIKDGVFAPLVHLAGKEDVGIQQDVARALCSITSNAENQVGVFGPDEMRALFHLAGSDEENCARDACIAIGNVAVIAKNQLAIAKLGGLPPLIKQLGSEFSSCQMYVRAKRARNCPK